MDSFASETHLWVKLSNCQRDCCKTRLCLNCRVNEQVSAEKSKLPFCQERLAETVNGGREEDVKVNGPLWFEERLIVFHKNPHRPGSNY